MTWTKLLFKARPSSAPMTQKVTVWIFSLLLLARSGACQIPGFWSFSAVLSGGGVQASRQSITQIMSSFCIEAYFMQP